MRISSSMLTRQAMKNIEKTYNKMAATSDQVSSGKKYANASESPTDAHMVNNLKIEQKEIKKYFSNIDNSRAVIDESELALRDINSSLQRIKELSSNAMNGIASSVDRAAIAQEMSQCKDQIISSLNATNSGKYIFGGYNSKLPPVDENTGNTLYNGVDIALMTETEKNDFVNENVVVNVNKGIKLNLKISALEITGVGDNNMLNNIDNMIANLQAGSFDENDFEAQVKSLSDHCDNVLTNITKVGATSKRLDAVEEQLESKEALLTTKISNIEDVDFEEAVLNYKLAEQAYNATLSMSGKSIQLTLMDYIG